MDAAQRAAIAACGTCGQPEEAHQHPIGEDPDAIAVIAALGGACSHYTVSDAAMRYQRHLAITDHRAPARKPGGGPISKRPPLCTNCGHRGHRKEDCPL